MPYSLPLPNFRRLSSATATATATATAKYLTVTVKRLAKSRRFEEIKTFIESHKNDPKITQESYLAALIRSYGRAGMFDHAIKTFDQMEELGTPRSAVSFNALLFACNQSKLFDKVPELFHKIPRKYNLSPDKISYGILVKSYCEMGSLEKAIDKLKEMEENGVEITAITFTTILDAVYKKGKSEEAEKLWNMMVEKGVELDVVAYNVKIMYVHGGELESVKALIDEMIKMGLKPDIFSYNCLMTCYCKNGMMDEAKKVYEGLKGNGCNPNAATFRTLVYYLCRSGDFENGYEVFKETVKMHKIPNLWWSERGE